MSAQDTNATMAVFLDLENIAVGAMDAHYPQFDIQKVLERLLLKGHIVVKKAYCDFERGRRSAPDRGAQPLGIPRNCRTGASCPVPPSASPP